MKEFNFDYDLENDDLFFYLENEKSTGSVELGNFILDFDKKGNLVAMQILDASKVLSKILSKIIKLTKIKKMQADIINFRNMDSVRFEIITDTERATANILVPHIKEKSPALLY